MKYKLFSSDPPELSFSVETCNDEMILLENKIAYSIEVRLRMEWQSAILEKKLRTSFHDFLHWINSVLLRLFLPFRLKFLQNLRTELLHYMHLKLKNRCFDLANLRDFTEELKKNKFFFCVDWKEYSIFISARFIFTRGLYI